MQLTMNAWLPLTPIQNDLRKDFANQTWFGCRIYRCDVCGAFSPVVINGRQLWLWFVRHVEKCKTGH